MQWTVGPHLCHRALLLLLRCDDYLCSRSSKSACVLGFIKASHLLPGPSLNLGSTCFHAVFS